MKHNNSRSAIAGFLTILLLSITSTFFSGCTMTQAEYEAWESIIKKQNRIYEFTIEETKREIDLKKEEIKVREEEKKFLIERGKLLERENALHLPCAIPRCTYRPPLRHETQNGDCSSASLRAL